jgi:protein-S-isoprenylcysteine O-methyltransferase Ste14
MESLHIIQQTGAILFVLILSGAFIYSFLKRRRLALGSFLTTVLPLAVFIYLVMVLEFDYIKNPELFALGIIIMLGGAWLNWLGISQLGLTNSDDFWFSRYKKKQRTFVRRGIYKRMRHPIAVSLILFHMGIVILFFHPVTLSIFVLGATLTVYTSFAEEKFLQGIFPEYRDYMKKTGRFFPKF